MDNFVADLAIQAILGKSDFFTFISRKTRKLSVRYQF